MLSEYKCSLSAAAWQSSLIAGWVAGYMLWSAMG